MKAASRTAANHAREEVRSEWVTIRKVTGTGESEEGEETMNRPGLSSTRWTRAWTSRSAKGQPQWRGIKSTKGRAGCRTRKRNKSWQMDQERDGGMESGTGAKEGKEGEVELTSSGKLSRPLGSLGAREPSVGGAATPEDEEEGTRERRSEMMNMAVGGRWERRRRREVSLRFGFVAPVFHS